MDALIPHSPLEILQAAERHRADLIVMGSMGRQDLIVIP